MVVVSLGLCRCGCGQQTTISNRSNAKRGWVMGQPRPFVLGHNSRRGTSKSYKSLANGRSVRAEHRVIVERILGKRLPRRVHIHHVNGDPGDNRHSNLVACESVAYHMLLHRRQEALASCGHADWRKCHICGQHSDPAEMKMRPHAAMHRECLRKYERDKYHAQRASFAGMPKQLTETPDPELPEWMQGQ